MIVPTLCPLVIIIPAAYFYLLLSSRIKIWWQTIDEGSSSDRFLLGFLKSFFHLHHMAPQVLFWLPGDHCYGSVTVTVMQNNKYCGSGSDQILPVWLAAGFLALSWKQGRLICHCRRWDRRIQNLHVVTKLQMGFQTTCIHIIVLGIVEGQRQTSCGGCLG